ncbi:MAG: PD-(D/E)XK nuclease family protein [Pirellulaceae bacterium]
MPITRKFMDWSRPALPMVADYLLQRYTRDDTLDLDRVVLVFPGGRAGRRLLEVLVEQAADRHLILLPPHLCTVGTLPELLYESKRPFASDLVQRLAWVRSLQNVGPEACRPFIPQLPGDDDYVNWMSLGALLQRQHRELAADALNFAEVARRGREVVGFQESNRWQFLGSVQDRYLAILDQLELWDLQTARLFAIQHRECRTDKDIVLIATTDMNVAMRRMLDQVAERVTAMIHADDALADRFDEHGCLVSDAWQDARIALKTQQMRIVQGPADQADAVVDTIAACNGRYRADQIVVGVLDEQLVPHLLRRLQQSHLAARWVVGKTLRETAPYRLLAALSSFIHRGRFADFAALVRHPDVETWLDLRGATPDWLADADRYYNRHLPPRLGQWLGDAQDHAALQQIYDLLQEVTKPLVGTTRSLAEWAPPIAQLLLTFYGDRVLAYDDPHQHYTLKSLEVLRAELMELQNIPQSIAPTVSASRAIEQLLDQLRDTQIPAPQGTNEIELLGWLELPLDAAPVLIATAFNEGRVPTSVNSDLFLPNSLRQQLDLLDNRRRYARDAYALSVLLASRTEVTFIAGRYSADGDPLIPSRLAFATDPETMARRAREYFRAEAAAEPQPRSGHPAKPVAATSGFVVRKPPRLAQPITSVSVTAFRSYLACRYRFYLRHVLNLAPLDDVAEELGPDTFGTLIHDVLGRFGADPLHTATDPDKIRHFLHHALNQYVTSHYGSDHLAALEVQIAQARARLDAFADWQARWAADGWEIKHVETSGGKNSAGLQIDENLVMTLRGRIDRIDERDGQWVLFDYKTGDTAKTPQETHFRSGKWVDLQLPLYVDLAKTLQITGPLQVGYIVLPKDVAQVGHRMADWDASQFAAARMLAAEVARGIYHQEFWPPTLPAPDILTDYAAICQDDAFRPQYEYAGDAASECECECEKIARKETLT